MINEESIIREATMLEEAILHSELNDIYCWINFDDNIKVRYGKLQGYLLMYSYCKEENKNSYLGFIESTTDDINEHIKVLESRKEKQNLLLAKD